FEQQHPGRQHEPDAERPVAPVFPLLGRRERHGRHGGLRSAVLRRLTIRSSPIPATRSRRRAARRRDAIGGRGPDCIGMASPIALADREGWASGLSLFPLDKTRFAMPATYNILIMGASYGSLLASKLLFGGHTVKLVCLPAEADLINAEGFRVRMPVRGRKEPVEIDSRKLPGKVSATGPGDVDPADYDLVGLAMQEPQYRSQGVRELL